MKPTSTPVFYRKIVVIYEIYCQHLSAIPEVCFLQETQESTTRPHKQSNVNTLMSHQSYRTNYGTGWNWNCFGIRPGLLNRYSNVPALLLWLMVCGDREPSLPTVQDWKQ